MKTTTLLKLAAVATLSLAANLSNAQITNALVVHLTFDGKNGSGNYSNTVANSIEGTPVGTPTSSPGKLGSAVALTVNGTNTINNYVTLGYPTELQFGAVSDNSDTDFSVAFWCNYTNQTSDPAFIGNQNWNSGQNPGWLIYMQGGGNFGALTKDDSGDGTHQQQLSPGNPGALLRDGTWHHVVVTWGRRGVVSFYKDGALLATSPVSQTTGIIDTMSVGQTVNIGQDGTGTYQLDRFNVQDLLMDDLGIWRRELSGGEVGAIYTAGLGGTNISKVPTIEYPFVKSTSPALQATGVSPASPISVVVTDGAKALDNASVKLRVNGNEVPTVITKAGVNSTITHTPTALWPAGANTTTIIFANTGAPQVFVTNTWTYTIAPYTTLSPSLKVVADTSKPGFKWNIFANAANTTASNARTEAALAGVLTDVDGVTPLPNNANPAAKGVAIANAAAPNPANAPIKFEIAGPLNLDIAATVGTTNGNFGPDGQMPGLPATDASTDGAAAEAITYISLPAGLVAMGVNSDDGFRTTAGLVPQDVVGSIRVGEFNGTRTSADTIFYLSVQEAGVYGFRTSWQNSTTTGNIEWFTLSGTNKVLVNDTAGGGLASYRALTTPIPPYVKYVSPEPVPRVLNQPSRSLLIVLSDGTTALDDNSIVLKLDGNVITPIKVRSGSQVTLTYTPTTLQFNGDQHLADLTFSTVGGTFTTTERWSFFNLLNIVLPSPVLTENFDSTAEGGVPTSWIEWNFTDTGTAGLDLDNLNSDSYKPWLVVARTRLELLKGRIFQVAPGQTINGVEVTVDTLSSGNLLYAETDVRGGNQVQFLKTSAFNLSAVANPALSFASLYEQNQDNLGAVEYSVDGGTNWLPVVYFIDEQSGGGDIRFNADGSVDAVATFNNPNADTAAWVDAGIPKGDKYGDGIAVPITPALGRFIYPRINDNSIEGKRIEIFRLPSAGNKSDVRLRFAQLGTGSWYFGVDNIAFYSVAAPPILSLAPTITAITTEGTDVVITWTGGTGPFLVQGTGALGSTWVDLQTTSSRTARIPRALPMMFLRIQDGTTKTVTLFKSVLNGANERPNPVTTPGNGIGLLALDGTTASYWVTYSGLAAVASAAHVHGPADATTSAGVMFGLTPVGAFGTAGVIAGNATVTATQAGQITAGNSYFNIHTSANPGGEIRGQLLLLP